MSTYYYCYVLCARTEIEQISYWFGSQNTQTTFQMNWWRDNFTFILKLVIYSIVCTPRKFVTKNTAIVQRPERSEKITIEMLRLIWEVNIKLFHTFQVTTMLNFGGGVVILLWLYPVIFNILNSLWHQILLLLKSVYISVLV